MLKKISIFLLSLLLIVPSAIFLCSCAEVNKYKVTVTSQPGCYVTWHGGSYDTTDYGFEVEEGCDISLEIMLNTGYSAEDIVVKMGNEELSKVSSDDEHLSYIYKHPSKKISEDISITITGVNPQQLDVVFPETLPQGIQNVYITQVLKKGSKQAQVFTPTSVIEYGDSICVQVVMEEGKSSGIGNKLLSLNYINQANSQLYQCSLSDTEQVGVYRAYINNVQQDIDFTFGIIDSTSTQFDFNDIYCNINFIEIANRFSIHEYNTVTHTNDIECNQFLLKYGSSLDFIVKPSVTLLDFSEVAFYDNIEKINLYLDKLYDNMGTADTSDDVIYYKLSNIQNHMEISLSNYDYKEELFLANDTTNYNIQTYKNDTLDNEYLKVISDFIDDNGYGQKLLDNNIVISYDADNGYIFKNNYIKFGTEGNIGETKFLQLQTSYAEDGPTYLLNNQYVLFNVVKGKSENTGYYVIEYTIFEKSSGDIIKQDIINTNVEISEEFYLEIHRELEKQYTEARIIAKTVIDGTIQDEEKSLLDAGLINYYNPFTNSLTIENDDITIIIENIYYINQQYCFGTCETSNIYTSKEFDNKFSIGIYVEQTLYTDSEIINGPTDNWGMKTKIVNEYDYFYTSQTQEPVVIEIRIG